jgi:hypothetical protein
MATFQRSLLLRRRCYEIWITETAQMTPLLFLVEPLRRDQAKQVGKSFTGL